MLGAVFGVGAISGPHPSIRPIYNTHLASPPCYLRHATRRCLKGRTGALLGTSTYAQPMFFHPGTRYDSLSLFCLPLSPTDVAPHPSHNRRVFNSEPTTSLITHLPIHTYVRTSTYRSLEPYQTRSAAVSPSVGLIRRAPRALRSRSRR